ncbi:MAG: FG-GAP-like repeat-containing protein, partial [Planctomycetota bacterium]
LATDLGDLDGDGDLDWILASFNGDWRLFVNIGQGMFQFQQEFPAPDAASCSLMMDFDNDGDLDLALIDELEDVVILMQQQGPIVPEFVRGDCNQDDMMDIADSIFELNYLFVPNGPEPGCDDACDMNDDGTLDIADGVYLITHLFSMGSPPPDPFPGCGFDPTDDFSDCTDFPACP